MGHPVLRHGLCGLRRRGEMPDKILPGDHLSIHLKSFPHGTQVGGQISPCAIPCLGQDRGKVGQHRPLSVCTGDVDKFQIPLRIAETLQQLSHTLQAEYTSVLGQLVQI